MIQWRRTIGCNGERPSALLTWLIARAFPLNRDVMRKSNFTSIQIERENEMTKMTDLQAAKAFLGNQLLRLSLGGGVIANRNALSVSASIASAGRNVHAVGIGKKLTNGTTNLTLCVRVYVVQKLPLSLLSPRDVIPPMIDGIPTDIIESEPPFAFAARKTSTKRKPPTSTSAATSSTCTQNRRNLQRPVMGGISAGHRDITVGTLGCFCRSTNPLDGTDQLYALSNNHVFANVNAALLGDPLYQPGSADGGGIPDFFATLHRFVPIRLGGVVANRVDAAIGRPLPNTPINADICTIGNVSGTVQAQDDMLVRKHGRTTGYTEGRIDDIDYTGLVGMDHGDPSVVGLFENQLRIVSDGFAPIGLGGDSGSVVLHRTERSVVGLYFAGPPSGLYGLANRIEHVLSELEVSIP